MMQLTDSSAKTCNTIWDWRKNVEAARDKLEDKAHLAELDRVTRVIANGDSASFPADNSLTACLVSRGEEWNSSNAALFTEKERAFAIIRRYNSRNQWRFVPTDPATLPCNVGTWKLDTFAASAVGYVERVCKCADDNLFASCTP